MDLTDQIYSYCFVFSVWLARKWCGFCLDFIRKEENSLLQVNPWNVCLLFEVFLPSIVFIWLTYLSIEEENVHLVSLFFKEFKLSLAYVFSLKWKNVVFDF